MTLSSQISSTAREVHIGCQSWGYDDWITPIGGETVFYPSGTKHDEMLALYSRVFNTIEVDSTVYGMPTAATVEKWYEHTPPGFTFSLKMPREVTHERSLDDSTLPIVNEFVERVSPLREKLGVILIQLPGSFEAIKENAQDLRRFLAGLPRDIRFAVEFRHMGWFNDWTYDELAENGVAMCLVEGKWVPRELMFASLVRHELPFAYFRFMGERDLEHFDRIYRDRDETLVHWSKVVKKIESQEIFIYVDNYFEGHAPATANKLNALLDLPHADPTILEEQPSLF
ncbi:MAG: DUF72 domain-containing protein [Acidobacteriota bacterium]